MANRGNLLKYYDDDMKKLKENVNNCDKDILNSLEYFLEEANSYTSGIPIEIENEIKTQIHKFRENCKCLDYDTMIHGIIHK